MDTVPEDWLDTWREIAEYLGISVAQAQELYRTQGLPVHQMRSNARWVYAYPRELDAWRRARDLPTAGSS